MILMKFSFVVMFPLLTSGFFLVSSLLMGLSFRERSHMWLGDLLGRRMQNCSYSVSAVCSKKLMYDFLL